MHAQHCRVMAAYNRWMNDKLYSACAELSDEDRKQDRGAFFKSIHGTLNHLLLGDRIWMGRFQGAAYAVQSLDEELYGDFQALRKARRQMDSDIEDWAGSLTDQRLAGELTYTSIVNPEPRRYPMWLAVTHFFNHQTHHRGQLTTLLAQCGVDYGVTDLIWLPEALEMSD